MRIEKVRISSLIREDEFIISALPDPELHLTFINRFAGLPPIITDNEMTMVSGYDSYQFFLDNGNEYCDVLISPLDKKDALFLSYNSRAVLKPLSLYEKLRFLKNIIRYSEIQEIYQRTGIGIRVDDKLISLLPELTGDIFREMLSADLISLRTAVRLCSFEKDDREALLKLFAVVRFSHSNEQNILDMADEICFRDKCDLAEVFLRIDLDSLLRKKEPAEEVLTSISRLRYPAYTVYEKEWKEKIGKIKFPFRYTIQHSPFFEKKGIELRLFLDSIEKIKEISDKF